MTIGDIIDTANAWHGGMWSSLYSFASTERMHDDDHRDGLIDEIDDELQGDGMGTDTLADERIALRALMAFVVTAPVGASLKYALVADDGQYAGMNNPMVTA